MVEINGKKLPDESAPEELGLGLSARVTEALGGSDSPAEVFGEPFSEEISGPISVQDLEGQLSFIQVQEIALNPHQTREIESDTEVEELSVSLRRSGVLQPILVRTVLADDGETERFELVAGERRLRAARLAGFRTIPAIVQNLSDREAVEYSIVENAQRENLNPIEEALAYQCLVKEFKLSQKDVAEVVGKNRATISNALRLLQLDERVVALLREGVLSAGHGRALLAIDDENLQYKLALRTVKNELSVRALESLVARKLGSDEDEEEELNEEDAKAQASLQRQETRIANLLDLEGVTLKYDSAGRKRLNLVFETEAAWKRFVAKIRD